MAIEKHEKKTMQAQRLILRNRRGFTLIEVLVSLAIFSLIVGVVYSLFSNSKLILDRHRVVEEVVQNNRLALRRLVRESRFATQIINTGDASLPIGHFEFETKYLLDSDDGIERLHYEVTEGELRVEIDMGAGYDAPVVVAENVQSLTTNYNSLMGTMDFVLVTTQDGKTYQTQSMSKVRVLP